MSTHPPCRIRTNPESGNKQVKLLQTYHNLRTFTDIPQTTCSNSSPLVNATEHFMPKQADTWIVSSHRPSPCNTNTLIVFVLKTSIITAAEPNRAVYTVLLSIYHLHNTVKFPFIYCMYRNQVSLIYSFSPTPSHSSCCNCRCHGIIIVWIHCLSSLSPIFLNKAPNSDQFDLKWAGGIKPFSSNLYLKEQLQQFPFLWVYKIFPCSHSITEISCVCRLLLPQAVCLLAPGN